MFCMNCGTQVPDNASFCPRCGTKLAAPQPQVNQPVQPTVEQPAVAAPVVETPVVETPVVETPVVETPVGEEPKSLLLPLPFLKLLPFLLWGVGGLWLIFSIAHLAAFDYLDDDYTWCTILLELIPALGVLGLTGFFALKKKADTLYLTKMIMFSACGLWAMRLFVVTWFAWPVCIYALLLLPVLVFILLNTFKKDIACLYPTNFKKNWYDYAIAFGFMGLSAISLIATIFIWLFDSSTSYYYNYYSHYYYW